MQAAHEIELPKIKGSPVDQLPENLYVPPKALLLLLDVFSGPCEYVFAISPKSDSPQTSYPKLYMSYTHHVHFV